jgi:hypothetical protein
MPSHTVRDEEQLVLGEHGERVLVMITLQADVGDADPTCLERRS